MDNAAIAQVFKEIADFLEIKGGDVFRIRAYQRVARAIEFSPVPLEVLRREGKLREVQGIGEAIAEKIAELLDTGRLEYYERLRAELPPGVTTLMGVPGVGPKIASRLAQELGVSTIEELEAAIEGGKVAALPRLGDKVAENILRHIRELRRKDRRIPLGQALPVVEEVLDALRSSPGLRNLTAAGSLRRLRETVGDIDIIGTADDTEPIMERFIRLPQVREVLAKGSTKASVLVEGGLQVDLRLVEHPCFGSLLQHFTGSKDHNVALRERSVRLGLRLSEYGITDVKSGVHETFTEEEAFYRRMGLPWIPPELRENLGEIEVAERGSLPRLVELADIKGDFHAHTLWSDGQNTLEEMAHAAKARGYQYLAISDHSAGLGIAKGLTVERLRQQMAEIRALNERPDGIRLLSAAEVDIRADGHLDYPDEVLQELDVVVASVHSAMGQDQAKMTERVITAMRNPHMDILGHPTGRLLGQREPIDLDLEAIFRAAAATGTALEINAQPSRLDLKDRHSQRARELGVMLVIASDAHHTSQLDHMRFGVGTARRGWCEAKDILNTRPLEEVLAFLHRH